MQYVLLERCTQTCSRLIDDCRELCGGGVFQTLADISVMQDAALGAVPCAYWQTPQCDAITRMKLFKPGLGYGETRLGTRWPLSSNMIKFYAGAAVLSAQSLVPCRSDLAWCSCRSSTT